MSEMDNIASMVEGARSKGKFNLAEVIKGKGNPEDVVEVYLDSESAYELSKLSDKIIESIDEDEIEEIKKRADELTEKILKSKLTFYMRGIDQGLVESIERQAKLKNIDNEDEDLWFVDYFSALVAENVYKVEDADGNIDESKFTLEDANQWRSFMPAEAWGLLVASMQKLTLATGYFRGLTDAGFLPKS